MSGSFHGIEVARRALAAQQMGLDVAAHNIANANTVGYSRQRALHRAAAPLATSMGTSGGMQPLLIGSGVDVTQVERIRDSFVDERIRRENPALGRWQARQQALEQIELMINEPSDTGIRATFDLFWGSLQDLANAPESEAARAAVRQTAVMLTDAIRHVRTQLTTFRENINSEIEVRAVEINRLAGQLADVNGQIARLSVGGSSPNDLLDRRDQLLEELSKLVSTHVAERPDGTVSVTVAGLLLVEGSRAIEVQAQRPPGGSLVELTWGPSARPLDPPSGEVRGLFEVRDEVIPDLVAALDQLASTLIQSMNAQHKQGFDLDGQRGVEFFTGTSAEDIQLAELILSDPNKIAASSTGAPGDGSNALAMAQLKQAPVLRNGTITLPDFYNGVVTRLGVDAQEAQRMVENQEVLLEHMRSVRESISGVSLDEEMADLVRFQHAYGAAARVMTAMDEVLTLVVNRLGLVGR